MIVYGTHSLGGGTEPEARRTLQAAPEPSTSPEPVGSASPAARPTPASTPSRTTAAARPSEPPTRTATPPPSSSSSPSADPGDRATGDPAKHHRPERPRSSRPGHGDGGALSLGSRGPGVADLQRRLQQLYLYLGSSDGHYSAAVGEAVDRYQRARAIDEPLGVYGPVTRALLEEETAG
ncbi:peptidoglycan-binding protein [Streptomyces sp. NPDC048172]|uniref:peptidoglycan-binding domain-containing protein n=1 Tax=Streptomyces sp. NPDC048172 TaxID=3365505 RepID=UPI00371FB966